MNCLDEMRERVGNNHTIARYLDRGILGKIYKALNLPSTENDDEQILKNEQESSDSPIFEDNVVDASISDENDDY
ncbi:unnamed protein product [Trichobilharzia regenti]|nr:unnamed protein product [Trichobilharzia regenti]